MATYSGILAWSIPWTEEPDDGLQLMGSQRIGCSSTAGTTASLPGD